MKRRLSYAARRKVKLELRFSYIVGRASDNGAPININGAPDTNVGMPFMLDGAPEKENGAPIFLKNVPSKLNGALGSLIGGPTR